jgi:hypothetical protein
MIYFVYPSADTTIYRERKLLELNAGFNEIIELKKIHTPTSGVLTSRILMRFDNEVFESNKEKLKNAEFVLNLKVATSSELTINDEIVVYPLKMKWDEGVGRFHDTSNTEFKYDGASWRYADFERNKWNEKSDTTNYIGGGAWYEYEEIPGITNDAEDICRFKFKESFGDIKINITPIVKCWMGGFIENNGFILKFDDETKNTSANLQFFSKDTNTIYTPCLEVRYSDYEFNPCELSEKQVAYCEITECTHENTELESGTLESGNLESGSLESGSFESGCHYESGTHHISETKHDAKTILKTETSKPVLTQIFSEDFIPVIKTINKEYKTTERKKIRVGIREKYPIKTFNKSARYSSNHFVIHDIRYSVVDSETKEKIIDFNEYTKVSCDSAGHYFNFDFSCLPAGRLFNFILNVNINDNISVYEDNRNFMIKS